MIRSPESTESKDALFGQAAEEFFAAAARGERPALSEFARRYPEIAEEIRVVIPALALVGDSMVSSSADGRSLAFEAPRQLGDYRLVREIGRGGMGVVFEAEQLSIGRRVALKVLPFASLASETALKRFQNEIRTAASLEHPHIVSVFASGEDRGVHFFAMQLIRGQSLADIVRELRRTCKSREPRRPDPGISGETDRKKQEFGEGGQDSEASPGVGISADVTVACCDLSTQRIHDEAAYFRRVAQIGLQACDALQYAHDMGVVHRDIKPSNFLVDAKGRVWLADFGLALGQAEAGLTLTGDLVGTLRYMSPEQLLGRGVVDHRTDVYSLGATLYELATLTPPFEDADRQTLLRKVAEQEPRPPRTCDAAIPADLDTIIRKSMEKEAVDRYATVKELADDLERYVTDKPILARPPSLLHALNKWSRRHRSLVWSATALLAAATIGLTFTSLFINRARNEALDAKDQAIAERNRAERNFKLALEAIDSLYTKFTGDRLAWEPKLRGVRRELLANALEFYRRFALENGRDESTWPELGRVFLRIGGIYAEREELDRAALAYQRSAEIFADLVELQPDLYEYSWQLAQACAAISDLADAGMFEGEAIVLQTQAIFLLESFGAPFDPIDHKNESHRERLLAACYGNLGNTLSSAGKFQHAEKAYRRALELLRRLVELYPNDPACLNVMAGSVHNYAMLHEAQGAVHEAQEMYEEAIALSERAVAMAPDHPNYRRFLRNHHLVLGDLLFSRGELDEAAQKYEAACQLADALSRDYADVVLDQDRVIAARFSWACVLYAQGDAAEAASKFRQCLEHYRRISSAARQGHLRRMYRAMAQLGLALVLDEIGDAEAKPLRSMALDELHRLLSETVGPDVDTRHRDGPVRHIPAVIELSSELEGVRRAMREGDVAEVRRRRERVAAASEKLRRQVKIPAIDGFVREFVRIHEIALERTMSQEDASASLGRSVSAQTTLVSLHGPVRRRLE